MYNQPPTSLSLTSLLTHWCLTLQSLPLLEVERVQQQLLQIILPLLVDQVSHEDFHRNYYNGLTLIHQQIVINVGNKHSYT